MNTRAAELSYSFLLSTSCPQGFPHLKSSNSRAPNSEQKLTAHTKYAISLFNFEVAANAAFFAAIARPVISSEEEYHGMVLRDSSFTRAISSSWEYIYYCVARLEHFSYHKFC